MLINLFGGPGPTSNLKRDLQLLESLNGDEVSALREWFGTNAASASDIDTKSLENKLHLSVEEQSRAVAVLRFVLGNWAQLNLTRTDIESDLRNLEIDPGVAARILNVLTALEPFRFEARVGSIKQAYEVVGLPTVDDVNIVWDIRPVFEDFAYSSSSSSDKYTNFLGYAFVLLIEIECSRSDGKNETMSFQVSEGQMSKFVDALSRAKEQLSVIKTRSQVEQRG